MFSTTTMASSTTSPIASTIASSVSRLMLKPITSIRLQTPISDSGIVTTGMITERNEARNRKITTTTISTASISVFSHLVDRGLDELGGVVGHLHLHRRRQVALELREQRAHARDDGQRIALRGRLHADEDRVLAVEGDAGIRALRRQFDGRDVLQPHEAAVLRLDDHALELVDILQIGVGRDVGDDEVALGLAGRGLEVVGGDRQRDVVRRDAAPGHLAPDRARAASQRSGRRECRRTRRRRPSTASAARRASDSPRSPIPTAPRWRSRDTSPPWSGRWSW